MLRPRTLAALARAPSRRGSTSSSRPAGWCSRLRRVLGAGRARTSRSSATRARSSPTPTAASSCTRRSSSSSRARRSPRVEAAGYPPNVYVDDELYVERVTPEAERYASFQEIELHPVGDLDSPGSPQPPTKLVCIGDPDALDGLGAQLRERFAGRLWVSKSLPFFLEFAAEGVSKASGLAFLAERLGFSPRADARLRRRRERRRAARVGRLRRRGRRTPTSASRRSPTGSARRPTRRASPR